MQQPQTDAQQSEQFRDGDEAEGKCTKPLFYSLADVMKILGISRSTAYRTTRALKAVKIGSRWYFPATEIEKLSNGTRRQVKTEQKGDE